MPAPDPTPPTPADTAILILTHNGTPHLPASLTACLALDGLADAASIIVADNGSSDGALDLVARDFPNVTRLDLGGNLGFAAGYNAAAASSSITADRPWILFLNDDTAIDRHALRALCDALAPGDVCAGARLVDWSGDRIDFDGGAASWTGHGHPLLHGQRIRPQHTPPPARPQIFACGAAMLVHRATFLSIGGFDPDYFMYYEDVDFGWRLTLAGHDVRHVPTAVVRHRGGGSADTFASAVRARWHERNALANVVKNTAEDHLARVLPATLALAAVRAGAPPDVIDAAARLVALGIPPGDVNPSHPLPLPSEDWPGWPHLAPLDLDWPALAAARAAIRPRWTRSPADVVTRLGRPWAPIPPTPDGWAALRRAAAAFELEAIYGPVDVHAGLRNRLHGRLRRALRR